MTRMMDPPAQEAGEEHDLEIVDISGDTSALAALNRSEIDIQISTAKRYPRSIALSKRRMIEMATIDRDTAEECGYALKRTDKDGKIAWIEGPSIRMAEIAVSCWGNIRYGARVIEEGDRFIVAQGICHDLETNVYNAIEVRRRITTKYGKKFGDDMVGVTANAACSIAARNAVFKVIPRAIVNAAYDAAMKTASGDEKTFSSRRQSALAEFKKIGVSTEEVMSVLGKANGGIEDIDTTDLRRLRGLLTAINDGETTVDQVFRPSKDNGGAAELNERLKQASANVTKRPISEGQTLVPDPAAVAQAEQEMQDHRPEPDVGHAESPPEPSDIGNHAGKAAAREVMIEELSEQEWPHYLTGLQKQLADKVSDADFKRTIGALVLRLGKKGKESDVSKDAKKLWATAALDGRIDWSKGVIMPAASA